MKHGVQSRRIEAALLALGLFLVLKSGYALAKYPLFAAHPAWFQSQWFQSRSPDSAVTGLSANRKPSAPRSLRILGKMEIPRLNESMLVVDGDDEESLSVAAGHIPGTSALNESGNCVLAGHRDTIFRSLRNVHYGDRIFIKTDHADLYVVKSIRIVSPEDVSVLQASRNQVLTLITCFPFSYAGEAPRRYIVQAEHADESAR